SKLIDLNLHTDMLAGGTSATDPAAFINLNSSSAPGFSQSRRPFVGTSVATLFANTKTDLNNLLNPASPADLKSKFSISLNGGPFIDIDLAGVDVTAAANVNDIPTILIAAIKAQLNLVDPSLGILGGWDVIEANRVLVFRITSDSGDKTSVRIRRAAANDFAGPMLLGVEQGGIEVARYSNLRPVFNGTVFMGAQVNVPEDFITGAGGFSNLLQPAITGITIAGSPLVPVNLITTGATAKNFESVGGFDGVREKLSIIAQAVN